MSEIRQVRRRTQKKKMQGLRQVKQRGGREITVLNSRESERLNYIRQDPAFEDFRAVYVWLTERPPTFGCDSEDLFPALPINQFEPGVV